MSTPRGVPIGRRKVPEQVPTAGAFVGEQTSLPARHTRTAKSTAERRQRRRRPPPPLLVAAAVAVAALHGLLAAPPAAARGVALDGRGSLWAWHMKLSAKRGWLALHVAATDADGAAREFTLRARDGPVSLRRPGGPPHPEPASTLQYARHLRALFAAKGYAVASVRASSCVAVNGRPAQPLFLADANLLARRRGLPRRVRAAQRRRRLPSSVGLGGGGGVGPGAAAGRGGRRRGGGGQRASDAAYRWLHAPLHRRAALAEWAWVGRNRRPPSALADAGEACDATERGALPSWATRCSFLSAAEALWCPVMGGIGSFL